MSQLPEERIITELLNLTLSSHRVRLKSQSTGSSGFISIMLDELASCGVVRTKKPIFLWLAALCALIGLATSDQGNGGESVAIGLFLAFAFTTLYFVTQEQKLALASAGETIRIRTRGIDMQTIIKFIDAVEEAKDARYLLRSRN